MPALEALIAASRHAWDGALAHGERYGYRNSQVTVLAPTGTIGFMMDCDTTGVEPDLALVKYKKLVGGGMIKIVNNTVPSALIKLGYDEAQVNAIVSYIDATGTIEGAPGIKPEHLAVFDCSFKPAKGTRTIHYMGHIKMMAATQPFFSGAISKTVNLPQDCTVEDIAEAYLESVASGHQGRRHLPRQLQGHPAPQRLRPDLRRQEGHTRSCRRSGSRGCSWRCRGCRRVCRHARASRPVRPQRPAGSRAGANAANCKASALEAANAALTRELNQLLNASQENSDSLDSQAPPRAVRHRLPGERASVTHKFGIAGHEGYITVGLYPNGSPGEIFIRMAKEGSTVSGLMDSFATAISISLQHGVPLRVLCEKFAHTRFEPSGWTAIPRSATPNRSWITSSAGSRSASSPAPSWTSSPACLTLPVPVEGTVTEPDNTVSLAAAAEVAPAVQAAPVPADVPAAAAPAAAPILSPAPAPANPGSPQALHHTVSTALASWLAGSDATPQAVLQREARTHHSLSDENIFDNAKDEHSAAQAQPASQSPSAAGPYERARAMQQSSEQAARAAEHGTRLVMDNDRSAPRSGIAPEPTAAPSAAVARDLAARSGLDPRAASGNSMEDRGIYSPSEAMREMYDMGDAPSCATCGAIMTRSGSCYRCMSCGSTSGCS